MTFFPSGPVLKKIRKATDIPECYACSEKPTGKEHSPARAFFPPQNRYRRELISVPSCDRHNNTKSKEDTYAAYHISLIAEMLESEPGCAHLLQEGPFARTFEHGRKQGRTGFAKLILSEIRESHPNPEYYVAEMDGPRMEHYMELCARAIYMHDRLKKLTLPLKAASLGGDFRDPAKRARLLEVQASFDQQMRGCARKGANPDVFQYAICEDEEDDLLIIELLFYRTVHQWVFYPNPRFRIFAPTASEVIRFS